MEYKIKIEIIDEDDEVIVKGSTTFDYENVKSFGDCEEVEEEVGKVMRQLVHKVEAKEAIHELEAELVATGNNF